MGVEQMTYRKSGVDYDAMDPFKRAAQLAGRRTANSLKRFGITEVEESRGESAYLIEFPSFFLAHVQEGLGTKNLVADAMRNLNNKRCSYYHQVAQDTVAMIVNDLITVGALPLSVAMHLAAGNSNWFKDQQRCQELIDGWQSACKLAGATWAGGETPTLRDIIDPNTVELSGSAVGLIKPKSLRIKPENIRSGDRIVIFSSSGIHANGLTMARKIAARHPDGYLAVLSDGKTFGETLLEPTVIYVKAIEALQQLGVRIHYAVNITGHGWRKLMRATEPFVYTI
ncbi:MAG: phosphoribosylformylglycinamidine cyclo-ligase, partial [Actinobacteria bacterium]|nr:phosphoribosylformylglycinamidine cyclo-ligase [Actinomycetota bacterium]